ncbi:mesenteric estrogen-dependent adipogenesis protein-like [Takifugu flavidus]|uniref:mesenteric estrogen-dependent adipogenesis protein-like n=1 Tax=Takifugu flavidus TaxID=433684 RepID=UPI00254452E4|nr:mesenteric estrogen-dependent adipogenesis protein-like [Takifugu flavidus]XP_056911130.1 mesenteric estrogen-dependent adipogenesis protein-like [Takifugu flavidus]
MVFGKLCRTESRRKKSVTMMVGKMNRKRVTVTPLEEFLGKPPEGFTVEDLASGCRVHSDPERSLVLIDDLHSCGRNVFFCSSLGRKIKVRNLWEYSATRSSLLSKTIYLLVSAHEENTAKEARGSYVMSIDGCDPFIKWQMERGLDWTISSVTGESYRVDIDLSELLQSSEVMTCDPTKATPVWRDAYFTLKYYSDAMFDFSHWFGFSNRAFKLRMMRAMTT